MTLLCGNFIGAYAGSQWSLASFTVPQEVACVCAFGTPSGNTKNVGQGIIFAVCLDGSFHKYHFSANGVCNQVKKSTRFSPDFTSTFEYLCFLGCL